MTNFFKGEYDHEAQASYLKFCDCAVEHTADYTLSTNYVILADYGVPAHGAQEHIIGVEFLANPNDEKQLREDLELLELTDEQKALIVAARVWFPQEEAEEKEEALRQLVANDPQTVEAHKKMHSNPELFTPAADLP